ncbi:glycosyltransferase family 4 protein [Flavisolibacter ginsengisoli]|jgi:glycosyltransferase involved in cell wall biosynthesis|uniref:Glycosyltransferase involved in cell wall bisynthesis n=1 Tax=Flavisolibacter ginsengisoli DSM 18119 TaxID=1121884 RepID=A0A1M5BAP1_9BACT|nr:glycosyltransferase family 4 protein [Flavisolibacter ginsengisoli]SHF39252.1 Glycosyltransferase involved in cell wall bisynthesis [Flavisolibacter ginsengisoli DSM 18119]
MHKNTKIRVLIFIGSLRSGGKERRLIELLTYFKKKTDFEFLVVLTKDEIQYQSFYTLDIPYLVLKKKWKKKDPTVFFQFYKVCKHFKPHLIHTWGRMQSFYTLPTVVWQKIPLVNSQITGAPTKRPKWFRLNLIDKLNFYFSRIVLSNSKAGMESFNPPANKSKVIYNGINMNRFNNLPDVEQVKAKYNIHTPFAVLMAASFTPYKDYDLFLRVANHVTKLRNDITFIGAGGYEKSDAEYKRMLRLSAQNPRILIRERIDDVEALVNACTIGVLFSVNGEGISNSIIEYMSLSKPVIATAAGGTKEIIRNNENGYLIINQTEEEISDLIIGLINNREKYEAFGKLSKRIVEESFSLESMGKAFERVYEDALN